jgi:hypothetical protein
VATRQRRPLRPAQHAGRALALVHERQLDLPRIGG